MKIEKVIFDAAEGPVRIRCSSIFEAAGIEMTSNPVIAAVGAGGKTSLIMEMSKELEKEKIRHLVMTTTHMWPFEETAYRMSAGNIDNLGKLTIPADDQWYKYIGKIPVLIEADGSHGLPLKVPAAHEPVIPSVATHVIGVIGASCLGRLVRDVCHRYTLLNGISPEQPVVPEMLVKIIRSPDGLKKMAESRPFTVVINQADTVMVRERLMDLYPKISDLADHLILTWR